jgi:predicted AlkP superfamily pyrophosphatase or phosphodiesterase
VISVDGLRPDAITATQTPNISSLAEYGAYTWQAQTIPLSNTLPSHVSMLSGFPLAGHRIGWDDYLPAKGSITVPTVFSATRTAGLISVMIVGKHKFYHFQDTGTVDAYVESALGDDDVANAAVARLATPFDLMFVHLPDTDLRGHAKLWMSRDYLAQVSRTDAAVGRILAARPPYTTVILTADHGGQLNRHGSNTPLDTTIPWIIAGPRVFAGPLTTRVNTVDTAATAAYLLGLPIPEAATGRPVFEALTPR